jgi:hypothetical protein
LWRSTGPARANKPTARARGAGVRTWVRSSEEHFQSPESLSHVQGKRAGRLPITNRPQIKGVYFTLRRVRCRLKGRSSGRAGIPPEVALFAR